MDAAPVHTCSRRADPATGQCARALGEAQSGCGSSGLKLTLQQGMRRRADLAQPAPEAGQESVLSPAPHDGARALSILTLERLTSLPWSSTPIPRLVPGFLADS